MVCSLLPVTARADSSQAVEVAGITLADGQCLAMNGAAAATTGDNGGTYVAYFKDDILHLNGLNTTKEGTCIYWGNYGGSLTIDVSGTNTLERTDSGSVIQDHTYGQNLTIQGNGTLNINGTSGIWARDDITFQGDVTANITVTDYAAIESNCGNANMSNSKITIKDNAKVTATGGEYGIVAKNQTQVQIILEGNAELTADGTTSALCKNPAISYTYQWRTSGNDSYTPSTTTPFTNNSAPKYVEIKPSDISLSQTGTHTFTAATVGYDAAPAALSVTVTNNGTEATGALTVALSGSDASSFTLNKSSIADIAVSGSDTFTVVPKTGLSAGTYTETVTVSGSNGIAASFDVSFTVNPVTYNVIITGGTGMTTSGNTSQTIEQDSAMTDVVYTADDGYYFPENYSVETQNGISVTRNSYTQITVSGTPTGNVSLTLPDATAKAKETTPTATFTATGSDTGTLSGVASGMKYSINDGSSWTNIDSDADVNLTSLSACTISVVKKGGDTTTDSDAQTITVTKAAAPSTIVGVGCTSDSNNDGKLQNVMTAMEYKLSTADNWTAGTGSDITGLANGTYYVRVKANGTALASDYQTVTVPAYTAPVYSVSLDTSGTHTFSAAVVGYGAQTAKTVTVRNTGNTATGALTVTLSGSNTDSFTLSKTGIDSIAESGNDTFTIVPNTGLAAGTYTATVTVSGGNGITANFNVSFTVNTAGGGDNGNGGGWYDYDYTPPSYKVEDVTPDKADGSITSDHTNAQKGDDVTITVTPDRYYNVDGVIVKDKNGKEIPVTMNQDGTFSFEMPAGEVTVEPIFVWDNPFVDVDEETEDAEPVEWALKNGITTGATDTTFAPDGDCTRAQIVTFLWRAAGSPEPTGSAQSFADVDADDYFAKAVLWALENGITTGVTDTTFAPDAVCTRAQTVTFLHRAAGKPATEQGSAFDDVTADSYYAQAVAWAEANGITKGIGGSLFGSLDECTRIQIVTFLYRFLGELTD